MRNGGAGDLVLTETIGTPNEPGPMVTADLNGDGRLDVALAAGGEARAALQVFLNQSDIFSGSILYLDEGIIPSAIVVNDFLGAGGTDIAISDSLGGNLLTVQILGNGDFGVWNSVEIAPIGAMATAEFTGDTLPDIVAAASESDRLFALRNEGDAEWSILETPVPNGIATDILLVDVDLRNGPDIVVAIESTSQVSVHYKEGEIGWGTARSIDLPLAPVALASADFNGDGIPDVVAGLHSEHIAILLNSDGELLLSSTVAIPDVVGGIIDIGVGDLDGNSTIDIVGLLENGDVVSLLNDGHGHFMPLAPTSAGNAAAAIALGDFEISNTCTDLRTNIYHCGSCGNVCALEEYCRDGTCRLKADIDENNSIDLGDYQLFESVFGQER